MRITVPIGALLPACTLVLAGALPCRPQTVAHPPHAQRAPRVMEEILDFHSDVTLHDDATLEVTETVTVVSAGSQIRHGIYREFPTRYTDSLNNEYVVGFQMLSATCDSADTPFRVEDYANGKRIYLGDPRYFVQPGRHLYTLTYTTNRQLGFFPDHDELFWNVTGNGWAFDIEHASATVHLPPAVPAERVQLSGFTGLRGSHEADLTTATENSGFEFSTTRRLLQRQGLSILLSFPKGYFHQPTFPEKVAYFFSDNRNALFLLAGFLLISVYYLITWSAVGRDPARGVIMALYQPPQDLSPAATRYLMRMGFDNKTFAAAILDMAVRGFLTIKQQAGSYTLYLTGKDNRVLTPDEKAVAELLFAGRSQIWLHNENHRTLQDSMHTLKDWLASAEQKTYFVTNSRYLLPSVILSIAIVLVYLLSMGGPQVFAGAFLGVWLTVWTLGVAAMLRTVYTLWRNIFYPHTSAITGAADTGKAVLLSVFALPFLLGELMGFFFLLKMTSLAFVVFVLACGVLHVLFLYLMKAPTFAGRRLMDQVEGFKMFLGEVDGDRLNRAAPPEQTPAVFEKFLPYALALDVEQAWANKFSGVLGAASAAPGASSPGYTPSFYSGPSWNSNGFGGTSFASAFSGSLTSAISSS
ncbi:MAG TPA: DUF2207 domain-containing protein, partial [Candidatus Acidoferrum sp.]|nr:DUF2207 domain-containing protein [Candidatus Acidoferrum sp.]